MRSIKSIIALALVFAGMSFGQSNWDFDKAHSSVGFSVTHLVISEVTGNFKDFSGTVTSKKDDDFTDAVINFTAKTGSVNTDNEMRDKHLASDDFFGSEKYPEIKFVSKSMKKVKGNKYTLTGDLTMKDVTKQVKLDVTYNGTAKDPWGNTKAGFKINGALNRFDFNLKWNTVMEAGGAVVGKEVKINIAVELQKKK